MPKRIMTILGARPQFIKYAPLSKIICRYFKELIVHTGQHYDIEMSDIFFSQLNLPTPDINLEVGSHSHAVQTAHMMMKIEIVAKEYRPDVVLVLGDTNSTIAGALAISKLGIPLGHVEAGLRSFNRQMPEEINRLLTDKLSQFLFCPSLTAVKNLQTEGIINGVFDTGDVMYDALIQFVEIAEKKSDVLKRLNLVPKKYFLATVHRAENTDNIDKLNNIFTALSQLDLPVIVPLHPRTRKILTTSIIMKNLNPNVRIIEPVGYLDNLILQKYARKILTDSGGMQKEAYFLQVPCITLREETEWVETVDLGVNTLVGADTPKILDAVQNFNPVFGDSQLYGDGKASEKIVDILKENI